MIRTLSWFQNSCPLECICLLSEASAQTDGSNPFRAVRVFRGKKRNLAGE
jgi:hypothetical protein